MNTSAPSINSDPKIRHDIAECDTCKACLNLSSRVVPNIKTKCDTCKALLNLSSRVVPNIKTKCDDRKPLLILASRGPTEFSGWIGSR